MAFTRITGDAKSVGSVANFTGSTITMGAASRIMLVSAAAAETSNTFSISDSATNTWTTTNSKITQAGSGAGQSWYALSNGAGATAVTITLGTTTSFGTYAIDIFSGNATASPISAANTSQAASGGCIGSITPNDANCLVWSFNVDSVTGAGTIGGSAATIGADDGSQDVSTYRELSGGSGASQSVSTASGSGAFMMFMVAVKPVAAGGGVSQPPFNSSFDMSGMGSPGRFFSNPLQRIIELIKFYKADPA